MLLTIIKYSLVTKYLNFDFASGICRSRDRQHLLFQHPASISLTLPSSQETIFKTRLNSGKESTIDRKRETSGCSVGDCKTSGRKIVSDLNLLELLFIRAHRASGFIYPSLILVNLRHQMPIMKSIWRYLKGIKTILSRVNILRYTSDTFL